VCDVCVGSVVDSLPVPSRFGSERVLAVLVPALFGVWCHVENVMHAVRSDRHWELGAGLVRPCDVSRRARSDDVVTFLRVVDRARNDRHTSRDCVKYVPYSDRVLHINNITCLLGRIWSHVSGVWGVVRIVQLNHAHKVVVEPVDERINVVFRGKLGTAVERVANTRILIRCSP
jgi:hypothetical protein